MSPAKRIGLLGIFIFIYACPSHAQPLFTGSENRPSDAIALFEGKGLSEWVQANSDEPAKWKTEFEYMQVMPGAGNICTKREFTSFQLHIEFLLPDMPNASGQGKANSGVYLQGRYEIQILDSYGLKSQDNDCGGIYGAAAPLVNACRPPRTWQTYDIFFHAPRFDDKGNKAADARVSVLHNGVWIHDNVEVPDTTTASKGGDPKTPGPIMLQDHGNAVRYRNVWIRPI